MARIDKGLTGAFSGTVGPVIGYMWRGRMCMRSRPQHVSNPRTAEQMRHRGDFRRMVQLAASMRSAVMAGLHEASVAEGMTEYNLFVSLNFGCISDGEIDYSRLRVSVGDVAPVAVESVAVDDGNVLRVAFGRASSPLRCKGADEVRLYAYCPELAEGRLSLPVHRRAGRIDMALPDEWAGLGVKCYLFAGDDRQRCSESVFADPSTGVAAEAEQPENVTAAGGGEASEAAAPPRQADPSQLSLFDGFL